MTIEAVPAVRLLFDDGDKLDVRAREVNIPIDDIQGKSFKELDGFTEVDVRLALSRVGPFFAERVAIVRGEVGDLYAFDFRGSTSAGRGGGVRAVRAAAAAARGADRARGTGGRRRSCRSGST